ncbi:MAG: hypothetical protein ACI8YQ_004042 [Polaribacter sp.]|jgi:hypothetical protein
MRYLLQFRLKQAYRALRDVGWLLLLLVTPMVIIFVLGMLEREQFTGVPVIGIFGIGLILMAHARRQDRGFLRLMNYAPKQLFLMEYSLAVLPLSMIAGFALSDWINPLILQGGAALIAFLPAGFSSYFQPKGGVNLNWIPTRYFELKCILRKEFMMAAPLYLIGLLTAMFAVSMPVVVLLFMLMAAGAYDAVENRELLELTVLKKKWLRTKIIQQLTAFHIAMSPLYILFLLFHYNYWHILIAVILIATGLLTFVIAYKYAHYYPGRKKANSQLPMALFMLFLMNPFFAPGTLVYLWIYYRRANHNMKLYYSKKNKPYSVQAPKQDSGGVDPTFTPGLAKKNTPC